jgi:hypothetical protein
LSASVEDEHPPVLLDMPLDVERSIGLASLLRTPMWIALFAANGIRSLGFAPVYI